MPTITDWISSVTTIVLSGITAYYAIVTHKILKYQRELTLLEKRPFLNMAGLLINFYVAEPNSMTAGIQIGVRLKNVSRVILKYKVLKIIGSIQNITLHNPVFVNIGGYVYPEQTTDYTYDTISDIDITKEVIAGKLEYEIEYWSELSRKYKSIREYEIHIFTKSKVIQWKSLKEEELEI